MIYEGGGDFVYFVIGLGGGVDGGGGFLEFFGPFFWVTVDVESDTEDEVAGMV